MRNYSILTRLCVVGTVIFLVGNLATSAYGHRGANEDYPHHGVSDEWKEDEDKESWDGMIELLPNGVPVLYDLVANTPFVLPSPNDVLTWSEAEAFITKGKDFGDPLTSNFWNRVEHVCHWEMDSQHHLAGVGDKAKEHFQDVWEQATPDTDKIVPNFVKSFFGQYPSGFSGEYGFPDSINARILTNGSDGGRAEQQVGGDEGLLITEAAAGYDGKKDQVVNLSDSETSNSWKMAWYMTQKIRGDWIVDHKGDTIGYWPTIPDADKLQNDNNPHTFKDDAQERIAAQPSGGDPFIGYTTNIEVGEKDFRDRTIFPKDQFLKPYDTISGFPVGRHGVCPVRVVDLWLAVGINSGWVEDPAGSDPAETDWAHIQKLLSRMGEGGERKTGIVQGVIKDSDRSGWGWFAWALAGAAGAVGGPLGGVAAQTVVNRYIENDNRNRLPPSLAGAEQPEYCPIANPGEAHILADYGIGPNGELPNVETNVDYMLWKIREENRLLFYAMLYRFGCHLGVEEGTYITSWERQTDAAYGDIDIIDPNDPDKKIRVSGADRGLTGNSLLPQTSFGSRPLYSVDWQFGDVGPPVPQWGLRGDTTASFGGDVFSGEILFTSLAGMANGVTRLVVGLSLNFVTWVLHLEVLRSNADTIAAFISGGTTAVETVTGTGVGGVGGGWAFRAVIMVLVAWGAWQIVSKRSYGRVTRELILSLLLVIAVGFAADRGTGPLVTWVANIMGESVSLVASLLIQGGGGLAGDDGGCVWYYGHTHFKGGQQAQQLAAHNVVTNDNNGNLVTVPDVTGLPRSCEHYINPELLPEDKKTTDTPTTLQARAQNIQNYLGVGNRVYPVIPGTTCLFGNYGLTKDETQFRSTLSDLDLQTETDFTYSRNERTTRATSLPELSDLRRICPIRYAVKHALLIEPVNRNNYNISGTGHTSQPENRKQSWQCATLFDSLAFYHRPSLFRSSANDIFKQNFKTMNSAFGCYTPSGSRTENDQIDHLLAATVYELHVSRLGDATVSTIASFIGLLFITLLGLYSIAAQIMFLIGLLAMPVMGIMVVLPGKGRTFFKKWLTVMVRALLMIFAAAVLMLLFFYALGLTNLLAENTLGGAAWFTRLIYMLILGVLFWKAWKGLNGKVRTWSEKTGTAVDSRLDKILDKSKDDQFMKKLRATDNQKWDSASWIKDWRDNQKKKMEAGVSKPGDGTLRGSMKGLVGSSKVGKGLRDRTGINIGGDGFKAPTKGKLATPGSRMAGALGKVASGVGKARGKAREGAVSIAGGLYDANKKGGEGLWSVMEKATIKHAKTAKEQTREGIDKVTDRRQNVVERLKHRYRNEKRGTRKKSEQVAANANPAAMRGAKQNREQQNKIMDKINKTGKLGDDRSARELANNLAQSGAGADAIEWGKKTSAQNPQQIAEFKGAAMEATGRLFADEGMSDEDRARATAQNAGLESYSTLAGRSDYTTDDDDDLTAEEASKLAASRNVGDRVRALQSEHVNWAMVDRLAADGALGVRDAVRTQIKGMEINTEEDYQRSQSALHKLNTADRADGVFSSYAAGTLKDRERLAAHDATPADALMEAAKLTVTEPGKYGHNKDVLVALAGHKNSNDQVLEQVWQTAWESDDYEDTVNAVASVIARKATVGSSVLAEVTERFTQEINNDNISESTQKTVSGFMANRNVDDSYKHSTVDIVSDAYRRNGKDVGGVASGIAQSANAHIASRMSQAVPEAISGMAQNPNMSEKSPALTAIMKQDPDSEAANIIRERQDTDTLAQEIIAGSGDTVKSAEALLTPRREYEQPDKAGGDPVEVLTERDLSSLDKKHQTALMNKLNTEIDVLADGENSEVVKAAVESAMVDEMANGVEEGHETLADQAVFKDMKQDLNKKQETVAAEEVKLSEEITRSGQFVDTMLESDGYADKKAAEEFKQRRKETNDRVADLQEAQQAVEAAEAKLSAGEKDPNTAEQRIHNLKLGVTRAKQKMKASQNKLAEAEKTERQQLQITQAGGYVNAADAAAYAEQEQKITEREQAINTVKQQAKDIADVIQIAEATTVEDIQAMSKTLGQKEAEELKNRKQMFQATANRSGTTAAKEEGIRRIAKLEQDQKTATALGRVRQHAANTAGSVPYMTKIVKQIPSLRSAQ